MDLVKVVEVLPYQVDHPPPFDDSQSYFTPQVRKGTNRSRYRYQSHKHYFDGFGFHKRVPDHTVFDS